MNQATMIAVGSNHTIMTTVVSGKMIELSRVNYGYVVSVGTVPVGEFNHVVCEEDKTLALLDAISYFSKIVERYSKKS